MELLKSLIIHNENTKEFMVNECLEIRYKTFFLRSNMKHFFDTVFHHQMKHGLEFRVSSGYETLRLMIDILLDTE